jgi:hypothetical protein
MGRLWYLLLGLAGVVMPLLTATTTAFIVSASQRVQWYDIATLVGAQLVGSFVLWRSFVGLFDPKFERKRG